MQPLFNSFSHQIQSNASAAPVPQQVLTSNMLQLQPQTPYHLGNMAPSFIPQSNPLGFSQNNLGGVLGGHNMFQVNGQLCNLPSQSQMFPPPPQTLINPQLCLPFFGNPQFGLGQPPFFQSTQQLQGNFSMPLNSSSYQQQQHQHPHQTQNPRWSRSQGDSVKYNQGNISNTNLKNVSGKNFTRNPKRGFQKSQFHHVNSVQRKSGNQHNTKGYGNERAAKFDQANHMNPPKEKKRRQPCGQEHLKSAASPIFLHGSASIPLGGLRRCKAGRKKKPAASYIFYSASNICFDKTASNILISSTVFCLVVFLILNFGRSLALIYTDLEIQQWREERRKNYPSKAIIEKKLAEKTSSSKVIDREAKMRREQLKEILAKQAELGVEVAEIPSHYLSDSEKQPYGREENTRPKPTLLQKLLSTDIRRDKSRLLQAFRFMVMNTFFKDLPEKPLKFPLVIVKENGFSEEVVEEKALFVGKDDVSEGSSRKMAGNCDYVDNDNFEMQNQNIKGVDDDHNVGENNGGDEDDDSDVKGSIYEENVRTEEEEGEIID
ncbi:hypothetical protein JRO89_XS14G0119600 [Xanthoceras sorbifolium]|uniref:FMR1-interacting protein 1 conserved domain-containing protein n=1 Tax=Xanthoceras sorbifolium TaxID=99658 RepID=A0ABQ8H543_9ROSI|nr:hypothetical protein JRO89_XS14G0119600 [Xanthoceras sorbifolium]